MQIILPNLTFGSSPFEVAVHSRPGKITIREIIRLAPAVGEILQRARLVRNADWGDYEFFKRQLSNHVGWDAREARIRSFSYRRAA